jgi:Flp pilus assembly protein TadG
VTLARRAERGYVTTEVVLLTPVLLLLVMLVVQFGLWLHAQHVAQAAADEGLRDARTASVSLADAEARASAFLDQTASSVIEDRSLSVERDGDIARVVVVGDAPAVVPGLELGIRAVAAAPVERFRADE